MRELRHPWLLVHSQDRKSRQRCTKPRRQYGLSGATSLLSLEYLFCHTRALLKSYVGSLGPTFISASLAFQNTVRQAFALALYSRFPTWMSLSLGPTDIFSAGCRPSQTTRLLLSLLTKVSNSKNDEWYYKVAPPTPESWHRRSHLYYAPSSKSQQQVVVKVHKVFTSH